MTDWRARWEKTSAELAESRAECLRLRESLDELNAQTEGLFNAASRSDHVRAMVHTIRMQWGRIRELKNEMRERVMTERIDHAAEARYRIDDSHSDETGADALHLYEAQVHATLALVEQQRIANLIALGYEHSAYADDDQARHDARRALVKWHDHEEPEMGGWPEIRPEVAAALGITNDEEKSE